MMSDDNPRRTVSGERRATYYLGIGLMILGFLLFLSIFLSTAMGMGSGFADNINPGSMVIRALVGMGLMFAGRLLMNVGSRGLAGSGVVLDPQQAREDLEPWSRMAGGMAKDALDEANIHLGGAAPTAGQAAGDRELTFDEKLRRVEQLRKDGLLSEAEYQQKRAEILNQKW